jgi:antitoxin component YwqK of YwqJK toxin-antitoxin module
VYNQGDNTIHKIDYFPKGSKAAETFLKNGLKHQNSESYYQTGEQFRSALYYYDTLVTEVYFFKSGDTIKNFPMITDSEVHHIKAIDKSNSAEIQFDFYDGKIIHNTYQETKLDK